MSLRVIDAATVARTIPPATLVDTLRDAFARPAVAPPRTAHDIGRSGTLLTMPAWREGGALGVKLVTVFPGNGALGQPSIAASYLLSSATTGEPLALIDGTALTKARTAAVSLLGRMLLSPTPPKTMLMVGAGALAPHLVRAHAAGGTLRRILIWNRDPTRAAALAVSLASEGLPAEAMHDLATATRTADLVSCATLSKEPLIRGEWLRNGAHLDLIGSYRADMREADDYAIAAGGLAVDTPVAFDESGDLIGPGTAGAIDRTTTPDLAALVAGRLAAVGRITIFKAVGTAVADLAAAEELMQRLDALGDNS